MAGRSRSGGGAKATSKPSRVKHLARTRTRPAAALVKSPAAVKAGASRSAVVKAKVAKARASRASAAGPSTELSALRRETRRLRRALREAIRERDAEAAARARELARTKTDLERENEVLEAQLTKLVQEIGQLRSIVERVDRLEAEGRAKDARLAECEAQWAQERARLEAEIARASGARGGRGSRGGSSAAEHRAGRAAAEAAPGSSGASATPAPPRARGASAPASPRAGLAPGSAIDAAPQTAGTQRRGGTATVVQLSALRRPLQG